MGVPVPRGGRNKIEPSSRDGFAERRTATPPAVPCRPVRSGILCTKQSSQIICTPGKTAWRCHVDTKPFRVCELPGRPVPLPPSSLTSPTPPPSTRSVTTLMQKSGVPCCSQAQATAAASMSLTLASVNYRTFPRRGGANTRVAEGTHHRAARSPLVCCPIFCPTELYSPQSLMCASASHFTCTYLGSWKRV